MPTPSLPPPPVSPLRLLEKLSRSRRAYVFCLLLALFMGWTLAFPDYSPLVNLLGGGHMPHDHLDEKLVAVVNPQLCVDDDDGFTSFVCYCRDPSVTFLYRRKGWLDHHERMKERAAAASRRTNVVLLGDSLVERMNGTRLMGHQKAFHTTIRKTFLESFQTPSIHGMALGSTRDTTGNWLWHLQHGVLPPALQPKVIVIILGTNNMGIDGCSKRTTLAGMLQVLKVVHDQKPHAKILMHGLLPSLDQKSYVDPQAVKPDHHHTGRQWQNAAWINDELKRMCQLLAHCDYMDSEDLFFDHEKQSQIDIALMEDGLHPSWEGYKQWIPRIAERVQLLLQPPKPKRKGGKQ